MLATPLKVTAVIDNDEPAAWVCETLVQLDALPSIDVHCIVLSENLDDTELARNKQEATMAQARRENKFGHRLGKLLLYGYMDQPQIDSRPLNPTPLPSELRPNTFVLHENNEQMLQRAADSDILLLLGNARFSELGSLAKPRSAIWSAQHQHLPLHIEKTMLNAEPLLYVHLWQQPSSTENARQPSVDRWQRLASHALPQQSYFISDLINSAFCALPNLFASRLNWQAHGKSLGNDIDQQFLEAGQSIPEEPSNAALNGFSFLAKCLRLFMRFNKERVANRLTIDQWQLAFKIREDNQSSDALALDDYKPIKPPADKLWADPFIFAHKQKLHVFFEEMSITGNRAHISTAELDENGLCSGPTVVLTEDHHLSYPYVFSYGEDIFMIPETGSRRTISAYKAVDFPTKWERSFDLLTDVNAAESTLFYYDGYWWLFTNCVTSLSVGERDLLQIFYAKDWQTGPWHEHPLNPVVTGVDTARMGGAIFVRDGQLHRPSQYGAYRYGYGVNLSRIDVLNTTHYQETLVHRLKPNEQASEWLGTHTSVHLENLTVIDRLCRIKRQP